MIIGSSRTTWTCSETAEADRWVEAEEGVDPRRPTCKGPRPPQRLLAAAETPELLGPSQCQPSWTTHHPLKLSPPGVENNSFSNARYLINLITFYINFSLVRHFVNIFCRLIQLKLARTWVFLWFLELILEIQGFLKWFFEHFIFLELYAIWEKCWFVWVGFSLTYESKYIKTPHFVKKFCFR